MAYVCIVINTQDSIAQLNAVFNAQASNSQNAFAQVENFNSLIKLGGINGTMQITTRDTDPSISTSGSGSKQTTYATN